MKHLPHIVVALNISSGSGRDYLRGVLEFAGRRDWNCEFILSKEFLAQAGESPPPADGMIIDSNYVGKAASKMPVVALGFTAPAGVASVILDAKAIGRMAADHLLEQGFRRFAFYSVTAGNPIGLLLGKPFIQTLSSHGYPCDWFEVKRFPPGSGLWTPDSEQLRTWMNKLEKPVGVFCINDMASRDIAQACRTGELRVPEEVAILGISNDELRCCMCKPELSSINTGAQAAGYEAARLMQNILDGRRLPSKPVIVPPVRTVMRESTDSVAVDDPHVAAAVRHIRENLSLGVNVKQLVAHMHLGRRTLELAFREHLGRTIHGEIVRTQMQRASRLLEDGELPLRRIAIDCGLSNQSQLGKFFKKHMGLTPAKYRLKHQRKSF